MNTEFDLDKPDVRQALAETIVWCTQRQRITPVLENDRIEQRLKLMDDATELMRQGMVTDGQRLNPFARIAKRRKYRRGRALLSEVDRTLAISLATRLRSPELQPQAPPVKTTTSVAMETAVRAAVANRAKLVSTLAEHQRNAHDSAGKLLLYWPEENLADGAAEYASLGFFDGNNTPPWDTWVAFSNRVLLSWVPAEMITLVQKGIDVNPEECIAWLD